MPILKVAETTHCVEFRNRGIMVGMDGIVEIENVVLIDRVVEGVVVSGDGGSAALS